MGCGGSKTTLRAVHPITPPVQQSQAQVVVTAITPTEEKQEETTKVRYGGGGGGGGRGKDEEMVIESLEGSPELGRREQARQEPGSRTTETITENNLRSSVPTEDHPQAESGPLGGNTGIDAVDGGGHRERGGGGGEEEGGEGVGEGETEGEGELMHVESIASGDLASASAVKATGSRDKEGGEKARAEHPAGDSQALAPSTHPGQEEGEEKEKEDEEEEEEGRGEVVLTPVEAISNTDRLKEPEETKDDDRLYGGQESEGSVPTAEPVTCTQVLLVKPVEETRGKSGSDGLRSSSSSSLTRLQAKQTPGERLHVSGTSTQLKSASAANLVGSQSQDSAAAKQISRSRESLNAASQVYSSVSHSRESLKASSRHSSRSRESLRSTDSRKKADKLAAPSTQQTRAETAPDVATSGPSAVEAFEEKTSEGRELEKEESQPTGSETVQLGTGAMADSTPPMSRSEPVEVPNDETPQPEDGTSAHETVEEATGEKGPNGGEESSSVPGAAVEPGDIPEASDNTSTRGGEEGNTQQEAFARQSQQEDSERKSPSVSSGRVETTEVDKRTGQSESSIMEAVERGGGKGSGEDARTLGHELPEDDRQEASTPA